MKMDKYEVDEWVSKVNWDKKQIEDVMADTPEPIYTPRAYVNESTTERVPVSYGSEASA